MPATVLTNDSVGAPILTRFPVSAYNILKWALPQLGWTIAFDNDVDTIVFRNDPLTGSGSYLRIDTTITTFNYFEARVYDTMSDIDTGTLPTPAAGSSYWFCGDVSGAAPDGRDWVIIGNKRAFWIWLQTGNSLDPLECQAYFCGDAISREPLSVATMHGYASGTSSSAAVEPFNVSPYIRTNSDANVVFVKNLANDAAFNFAERCSGYAPSVNTPDPITGEAYLVEAYIIDPHVPVIRARWPGTYWPLGIEVDPGTVVPALDTPEGIADCWFFQCSASYSSRTARFTVLVNPNSEDWDDA